MLNKEKRLKKLLLKKVGITLLLFIGAITAAMLLSGYNESLISSKSTKQNQNSAITSQKDEIEKRLGLSDTITKDYNHYMENHNPDFTLKREVLNEMLPLLRKQYHFSNSMEAVISAANELTDPNFRIKSGKLMQSNVKITFSALTDNSVYNLIYDLQHKLPGIIIVSALKLERTGDISKDTIASALNGHFLPPAVNGELSFVWIGVKKEKEDPVKKP